MYEEEQLQRHAGQLHQQLHHEADWHLQARAQVQAQEDQQIHLLLKERKSESVGELKSSY